MHYPQLEVDYDVAAPGILCNADKIGAKIFLVPSMHVYDDTMHVRVLAFDRKTAVCIGKGYAVERDVAHYMAGPLPVAVIAEV